METWGFYEDNNLMMRLRMKMKRVRLRRRTKMMTIKNYQMSYIFRIISSNQIKC